MPSRTHLKKENEARIAWVDFTGNLNGGDTLTGVPTVVASPVSGAPAVTLQGINAAAQVVNGIVVATNKAASVKIGAGGTVGTVYNYLFTQSTTDTEIILWDFNVEVIANRTA
jgi:hypothetical protein